MRLQWSLRALVVALLLAWVGSSFWPGRTRAQLGISFGGRAAAVRVQVPLTGTRIALADTGTLPASGGGVGAALLSPNIPGDLTGGAVSLNGGTAHGAAVGLDRTRGEGSLANVNVTVSGNAITADFLMARSTASCASGPVVAGSSQLVNLVINGQSISVTGQPNQTVTLPNGTATIDQQSPSVVGTTGQLVVNALHVTTSDPVTGQQLADVVFASADAAVVCESQFASNFLGLGFFERAFAQTQPPVFTSGGGWIVTDGSDKGTFGVFGGIEDGSTKGHLVYIDHGIDLRVTSTEVTSFVPNGCESTISGSGESNQGAVSFTVTVTDNGEGELDTLTIQVTGISPPYAKTGQLAGGNIQVHHETCPPQP